MSESVKTGIIAAMEREIAPLVKGWRRVDAKVGDEPVAAFLSPDTKAVVLCAGIGAQRARVGTKVLVEAFCPEMVTSVGFAGALTRDLESATVFVPEYVIAGDTARSYRCAFGRGTLVSTSTVIDSAEKRLMAKQFGAEAVDMEAAAVAESVAGTGAAFLAIKAVSDGPEDRTDFLARFALPQGFQTGRFAAHVAVRPWLWPSVRRLAINSSRATEALCTALSELISDSDGFARRYTRESLHSGVTANPNSPCQ